MTCHCTQSCLSHALCLSCRYVAKPHLLEDFFKQGFAQCLLQVLSPSIFPFVMMNWLCLSRFPITFTLLVIIIFINILLSLTSPSTASFVACSTQFVYIMFLRSHISVASSSFLLYLPIVHVSLLYNRILQKYIFIFFFFFLWSYTQMFVGKKCLFFLKSSFCKF